jgi:hypothetical protein
MKRKAQFYYAGYGGKPVYVHGYLTDEHTEGSTGRLMFEVICSEPEPRPKPGLYGARELPGGWMALMPEQEGEPVSTERDAAILQAARAAGFPLRGGSS